MHGDQIDIQLAVATDLIHEQFPQFRGLAIVALNAAGTTYAVFRIGSEYAARFPLRMMSAEACAHALEEEMKASAEFNGYCPFLSPRPIGMGEPTSSYPLPWMVHTWLEGRTATPSSVSASSLFALDLARLIKAIRLTDLKGRRFDGRGRGGDLRDHDDWMALCFSKSETLLEVGGLRRMWGSLRDLPSLDHEVMSHKDLIPANLLVKGERLIGVLDTGGFGPADPALDLVAGWHLLDRESRAVFREALHSDNLEWRRGAAWALQQAMGLVWYYAQTNPPMSALGRSTICRLVADHAALI